MQLPNQFENKNQLKNMKVDSIGYTTPWAMWVDIDGNCWLNEDFPIEMKPSGTMQLKITKVLDGYIAHVYEMNNNYTWQRQNTHEFMTLDELCYGKVVGFDSDNKIDKFVKKSSNWIKDIFN